MRQSGRGKIKNICGYCIRTASACCQALLEFIPDVMIAVMYVVVFVVIVVALTFALLGIWYYPLGERLLDYVPK